MVAAPTAEGKMVAAPSGKSGSSSGHSPSLQPYKETKSQQFLEPTAEGKMQQNVQVRRYQLGTAQGTADRGLGQENFSAADFPPLPTRDRPLQATFNAAPPLPKTEDPMQQSVSRPMEFASALKKNTDMQETSKEETNPEVQDFTLKPTTLQDGKPGVVFKRADRDKYLRKMKHVLVGKFSHGRPPIEYIRQFFTSLKLKGGYNISLRDTKHLFIECSLMEDFTRIWLRGIWYVQSFPMRIFKWTSDFSPEKESPIKPVWITLRGLPLHFFEDEALFSIANSVGSPLRIDPQNVNRVKLGEARVCIALDVSKPLVDAIWVAIEDDDSEEVIESFWQSVEYDIYPAFCSECNHQGHVTQNCKRKEDKEKKLVEGEETVKPFRRVVIPPTKKADQASQEWRKVGQRPTNPVANTEGGPSSAPDIGGVPKIWVERRKKPDKEAPPATEPRDRIPIENSFGALAIPEEASSSVHAEMDGIKRSLARLEDLSKTTLQERRERFGRLGNLHDLKPAKRTGEINLPFKMSSVPNSPKRNTIYSSDEEEEELYRYYQYLNQ